MPRTESDDPDAPFEWLTQLDSDAEAGASLRRALLTSYERADERLLVEHLLPRLLGLERDPGAEGRERRCFLLELEERLKQLDGRVVVVTSTSLDEPASGEATDRSYPWIWKLVRPLMVGSDRRAVQHAKLWMFHWGSPVDGEPASGSRTTRTGTVREQLELVVSSTNLTRAAFRGQVQGAWRIVLDLHPRSDRARLAAWGVLPAFLGAMAASSGEKHALDPFIELLGRADCPRGATFVASVPGNHPPGVLRKLPWGSAGLAAAAATGAGPVGLTILSPYVGTWSEPALRSWCGRFGGTPSRVRLAWVSRGHPWSGPWQLPKASWAALRATGARLLELRAGSAFDGLHSEHREADTRWSHAKVYSFRRGAARRVLITSANFSPSAWGRDTKEGGLAIDNFELGVCLPGRWSRGDLLPEFDDPGSAAVITAQQIRTELALGWANASWDGKRVAVSCRCTPGHAVQGVLRCRPKGQGRTTAKGVRLAGWRTSGGLRSTKIRWLATQGTPETVVLTCGAERLQVAVFDKRPHKPDEIVCLPGAEDAQRLRDDLLIEAYGGPVIDDDPPDDDSFWLAAPGSAKVPRPTQRAVSYGVPVLEDARRLLDCVDHWAKRAAQCLTARRRSSKQPKGAGDFDLDLLRRDAQRLVDALLRRADRQRSASETGGIGAALAAEELKVRLEHLGSSR